MFGYNPNLICFLISNWSKTLNIHLSSKECSILSTINWESSKFKILRCSLCRKLSLPLDENKTFDRKGIRWIDPSWCFRNLGTIKKLRNIRNRKYCFYQKFAKSCSKKRYFGIFWNKWNLGKECYSSKRF